MNFFIPHLPSVKFFKELEKNSLFFLLCGHPSTLTFSFTDRRQAGRQTDTHPPHIMLYASHTPAPRPRLQDHLRVDMLLVSHTGDLRTLRHCASRLPCWYLYHSSSYFTSSPISLHLLTPGMMKRGRGSLVPLFHRASFFIYFTFY